MAFNYIGEAEERDLARAEFSAMPALDLATLSPPPREFIRARSGYLEEAFADPESLIADVVAALDGVDYDTFVGTGLSGALVVPLVARALGKRWAIVRKPGVSSHSVLTVEGDLGKRWLFLDDLIASGLTAKRVRDDVTTFAERHRWRTEYVGDVLYHAGVRVELAY